MAKKPKIQKLARFQTTRKYPKTKQQKRRMTLDMPRTPLDLEKQSKICMENTPLNKTGQERRKNLPLRKYKIQPKK